MTDAENDDRLAARWRADTEIWRMQSERQRQRDWFMSEQRKFRAEAAEANRALVVAQDRLQEVEMEIGKQQKRLAAAQKRANGIAAKVEAEAAAEMEKVRQLRLDLERALAGLRAYPVAKIESWSRKRRTMDPVTLPRFEFTGVSG